MKDEPQHVVMGRLQEPLLDAVELPYGILPTGDDEKTANLELDMVLGKAQTLISCKALGM